MTIEVKHDIFLSPDKVWSIVSSQYFAMGFSIIFFGYMIQTLALQYWFYYKQGNKASIWKIQPPPSHVPNEQSDEFQQQQTTNRLGAPLGGHLNMLYGWPLFSNKPHRAPYHRFFTSFNLFVASCVAGYTCHSSVMRWNQMEFEVITTNDQYLHIGIQFIIAVIYQSVVEYYWHRLMHWKYCYRYLHKFHHAYKSPEPWDDMYIHPLEAFGYYCILYGPPFLFPIHKYAFIAYMIVMGLCGVMDHSGIKIECPGLYNTIDHDNHHAKFEINYSFPFPFMDLLHGTYEGEFWGHEYKVRDRDRIQKAIANGEVIRNNPNAITKSKAT